MKSIYNSSDNTLQELKELEKPLKKDYTGHLKGDYKEAAKRYTDHLYSLRRLPCHDSCRGLWVEGLVLEEGKDYKVKIDVEKRDNEEYFVFTAFPLVPVKSEDELWGELMMDISGKFLIIQGDESHLKDFAAIDYLKQKFTLTKKQ